MRKRFLLSLLVALLTTLSTHAYDFQSGDLYYNITSDNTVEVISQYSWSSSNYQGLTTATIPETVTYNGTTYSVTSIGEYAFEGCSSLTSITLPNSVTSIGYRAFYGCTSLPIVDNLRYADTYLVEAVDKSLSTYTIKAGTKWIGNYAFSSCSSLTSITIPNSVTSIEYCAFMYCTSLTSITLPNSVTSIGVDAFYGCTSLPIVDNLRYADTYLVEAVDKSLSTYTIKTGTKLIGNYAFRGCSSLTSITLPNSVTSIGEEAFYGCSSLTSITLPNSVTRIGNSAFYECSSLTSITLPNSVTSIRDLAFYECSSLTSITIGNSVTSIGSSAFSSCSALTSITIPNSVTSIGNYAFSDCSSLTSVVWNAKNCVGWQYAHYAPFDDISANITSFTFGEEVETIPSYLCYGMSSLTSITLPNSVTSIESSAFNGCSSLTKTNYTGDLASWCAISFSSVESNPTFYSHNLYINDVEVKDLVTFPETVTSIGNYAFSGCTSITSLNIPNSVTSIGDGAFYECTSLADIYCYATTPPMCETNTFDGVSKNCYIHVPAGTVRAYQLATGWSDFFYYYEIEEEEQAIQTTEQQNKPSRKILRDGQVVILRNGVAYDMMGNML